MTVCPKCGYERTQKDDGFVSIEECPKCGIIYKKWKTPPGSESHEPVPEPVPAGNEAPQDIIKEKKPFQVKSLFLPALVVLMLVVVVKYTFFPDSSWLPFTGSNAERLEASLPATPPPGTGGGSWRIRASGNEETITALGQIFKTPPKTPVLLKLGFLFTQSRHDLTRRIRGARVQVMISEWYGDRPGPSTLWISQPQVLPDLDENSEKSYQADWLDFDVKHLFLKPERMYIAWITLSGLENPPAAIADVSHVPDLGSYPEGTYTLYQQANPEGDVSQMTNSAWVVYDFGYNLNFRMIFDNSIKESEKKSLEISESDRKLNAMILQKTIDAIALRKEKENKKQEEARQRQTERQIQYQQETEVRWTESERRRAEMEQQQAAREKQREYEEQQRRRMQVERELQQYESEKQREEARQRQEEISQQQRDRMYTEPRRAQKIPRRR